MLRFLKTVEIDLDLLTLSPAHRHPRAGRHEGIAAL